MMAELEKTRVDHRNELKKLNDEREQEREQMLLKLSQLNAEFTKRDKRYTSELDAQRSAHEEEMARILKANKEEIARI